MTIFQLSFKNVLSKPLSTGLSLLLLSLGVGLICLMLQLERQLKEQMSSNIRGIDMVVGAKGSPLQLILSAVFQVDVPTDNISLSEADQLLKNRLIDYGIPLSYGDSYSGFRIVGTEHRYPEIYQMELARGKLWTQSMEVTIGAAVAERTGLKLGDTFLGSHGLSEGGHVHEEQEYTVVGQFKASGSVLDQLILTDLQSVWDIHDSHSHEPGSLDPSERDGPHHDHEEHEHDTSSQSEDQEHAHSQSQHQSQPQQAEGRQITALLIKFKNPLGLVQLPRRVNEDTNLQAALPAYELNKLFSLMGMATATLNMVALVVILVSGLSVFISLYLSLKDRIYEMALLRAFGASKGQLLGMIVQEGLLISFFGFGIGLVLSRLILLLLNWTLQSGYPVGFFQPDLLWEEIFLFALTLAIGLLSALIPAISVYRIDISKSLSHA